MTAQKKAIELLSAECEELEERYEGYRTDAAQKLVEIIKIERDAASGVGNALNGVHEVLSAFGDKLSRERSESGSDSK